MIDVARTKLSFPDCQLRSRHYEPEDALDWEGSVGATVGQPLHVLMMRVDVKATTVSRGGLSLHAIISPSRKIFSA